jgi:EthD domain
MSTAVKVIYFAPKPKGTSTAEFRRRWRQHGELAMSLPNFRHMTRYEQRDALTAAELDAEVLPPGGAELGGVGQIWIRDDEAAAAVFADPDVALLEKDEEETFGRRLGSRLMPTRERVVVDKGTELLSIVAQLHRREGVSREQFARAWDEVADRIAASPDVTHHLARYVLNQVMPASEEADGVVEVGFASAQDAVAFRTDSGLRQLLTPFEAEFQDPARMVAVLTSTTVLYDERA